MVWEWLKGKKPSEKTKKTNGPENPLQPASKLEPSAPKMFSVGESIGGEYRVLQVMRGGMGAVYVVRHYEDSEFEDPMILKSVLLPDVPQATQLFLREAEIWVKLGVHQNLVQAFYAREIQGNLYVAAEFVAPDEIGRNSVADYIRFGAVPEAVVLSWIAQFCYGMDHAKQNGMLIHRDIKPGNLMVSKEGDLKITDFGIAKPIGSVTLEFGAEVSEGRVLQSNTMGCCGTPAYMAPEQIIGDPALDFRADIYSFGVSLFEICAGSIPFKAADIKSMLRMHLSVKHAQTGTVFDPIIEKCMAKQPTDRFQSFEELLEEARNLANSLKCSFPRRPSTEQSKAGTTYAMARSYDSLGKPDLAMHYTKEYIRICPNDYRGWTHKGRLSFAAGAVYEALEATEKSIELNPINTHAWNNLGLILTDLKRPDEAIRAFFRSIDLDQFNAGAMMNLSSILKKMGRVDDAKDYLSRALKLQPDKASIWQNFGVLQMDMGKMEDARDCFFRALELNPRLEEAHAALELLDSGAAHPDPVVLLGQGRVAEAKQLLIELSSKESCTAGNWLSLAYIFQDEGNAKEAVRCFNEVLKYNPNDMIVLKQMLRLHAEAGKFDTALAFCERLGSIRGQEVDALTEKAKILQAMGRESEAISLLRTTLESHPTLDKAWFILGELFLQCGRQSEALEAFTRCERLIRDKPEAGNNLAMVRERIAYLTLH